ncbi:MAG: AAA family ATPase [Deltaproteobacteria bacterium]|nr:AAA family ATPase [Deltaproteobacteria bacterium]
MEENLKSVEIAEDSFWELRLHGAVYVDKTAHLLELTKTRGPFFLARPRRFGKSLLLDTIQRMFEGRKELFTGLEIETSGSDFTWKSFPVIRINMNNVSSDPDHFKTDLISKLLPIANSYKVQINQSDIAGAISDLIINVSIKCTTQKMKKKGEKRVDIGEKNVVLLIDEYDFPLLKHLHNPVKIEKMRSMLYDFYSSIKGCSNFLRFIFITGITKFRQLSLFSALNNIEDISFDERFSAICGFTKDEITASYGKYLDRALPKMIENGGLPHGSTVDKVMEKITYWYDGYSWDGKTRVFNPFSIKNFLQKFLFKDYWYESGTSLFTGVLNSFDGNRFSIFGKNISLEAPLDIQDTANINDEAFLLQAGYLTIESIDYIDGTENLRLKIPNNEIRRAINKELSSKFQRFVKSLQFMKDNGEFINNFTSMKDTLLASLWSRDVARSEELLGSIFSGNPREWYRNGGEGSYKLILLALMRFGGAIFTGNMLEVLGEVYSDSGRADLLFDVSGKGYIVMELKYADADDKPGHFSGLPGGNAEPHPTALSDPSDNSGPPAYLDGFSRLLETGNMPDNVKRILEVKIEEAFKQISSKNYAKPYLASGKPILAAAVALYGTSTVMVRFANVVWKADGDRDIDLREIKLSSP